MNSKKNYSCIILAGGMSRRMGQDKGSMIINEKPMILHILAQLNNEINDVVIVLNDKERIANYKNILNQYSKNKIENEFNFNIKFVEDEIKNKGPLSGIMTGLKKIENEYGLILPCDSPYIKSKFINKMFNILEEKKEEFDSIIPYYPSLNKERNKIKNSEPLHSIYNKKSINKIKKLLNENQLNVKSLILLSKPYFVNINKELDEINFKNINSKEDLK